MDGTCLNVSDRRGGGVKTGKGRSRLSSSQWFVAGSVVIGMDNVTSKKTTERERER